MILIVFVMVQMTKTSRNATDLFVVPVSRLLEFISDTNGNDSHVPKQNIMGEWTTIPKETKDNFFALRFTYELETRADQPKHWVQTKNWEIESMEA